MSDIDNDLKRLGVFLDQDLSYLEGASVTFSSDDRSSNNASGLDRSGGQGASRSGLTGSSDRVSEVNKRRKNFDSYINSIISGSLDVTDRNQIINPEELLADFWDYYADTTENRALYNQYLEALRNFQAQQEAAFQEYYNSPHQQVLRDRQAGLNTDILGISGSSPASSAEVGSNNPFNGLPTSEELSIQEAQLRNQRIANLISSIGAIANLGSSFASIGSSAAGIVRSGVENLLTDSQTDSQILSNIKNFENLASDEIASRLSDSISAAVSAGESLNIDDWFADEDNFKGILESYQPSGSDFSSSFSNVRKRLQHSLGKAYEQGKVTAENQSSFAALAADPRYSADVLIQMAQLKPYMEARVALQKAQDDYGKALADWQIKYQNALDVKTAVDVANNKNLYDSEYYKNMDGEKQAIHDQYIKQAESIRSQMRMAIDNNLMDIYKANPNNQKGFAAAYIFDSAGLSWYEYLGSMLVTTDMKGFTRDSSSSKDWNGVEIPSTNPLSSMGASPSNPVVRNFVPPGSVGF